MRTFYAMLVVAMLSAAVGMGAQNAQIYEPGSGVTLPQVVKQVQARYTDEAMQNRIEGNVELAAVVLDDGKVGDVSVSRSLDSVHGLDEEAVKAMKQWEFKPGTKDDKPVAVRIHVIMRFALR
jgi:periplasmic protein TonB